MSILIQRTKYNFAPICSFVISCLKNTKFAVQVLAYHTKLLKRLK